MCQRGELQRDTESRKIPAQALENKYFKDWQTQILPHTAVTRSYRQHTFFCFVSLSMQKKLQNELINYSIATAISYQI